MLCDDLGGGLGEVGGRLEREAIRVYTQLMHVGVEQKLTTL